MTEKDKKKSIKDIEKKIKAHGKGSMHLAEDSLHAVSCYDSPESSRV